ncbi:methyl-accepting chemotaxis protein [Bacillus norwichensis]|uniref:MCP four helix bundle domain-containing protein n=1 Tax=Bacillus norwichensis TaxID=2762217 RepID=A0ABR8VLQ4_9BACI|nr:methyl-accepting chemotaxis protein [Bacillus norwichensis]MBD8005662.1 MCP four helix bundle domain-containing protein [Bacillus norwichensis]
MKFFSWFNHLKIRTKILSVFIIVAVLQIGINSLGLINMGKLNDGMGEMYNDRLKLIEIMADNEVLLQEVSVKWRDVYVADSSAELMESVNKIRSQIQENMELYSKNPSLTDEQKKLVEDFNSTFQAFNSAYDESITAIINKKSDYKSYIGGDLLSQQNKLIGIVDQLKEIDSAQAQETYKEAEDTYGSTKILASVIIIIVLLISVGMGLLISNVIARPLKQVVRLVEKVADGDLTETTDIETKDEIGALARSVNTMVVNSRSTVQSILSASENLSASSEQVAASIEEIASASTNQGNAAQTMNELFRELSEAINAVAENTEQAAELANKTVQIAQAGEQVVLSSVEGANAVDEQISNLEQESNKIGEIIGVIDDIADQTNLLALNAAIEAARAGDQGRGFAVVAEEVRKLAERSSEATKQITEIIKGMQENTARSVKSVREGRSFTEQSGVAFENIIQMVNDTGNKVTEIAGASEEQAAQSVEVLTFIESISATTEEAAASSEETASAAQSLNDLAEELNTSVSFFKLK